MDVYFTLQVETDSTKKFVSLPLLVYASDTDEAMTMSQSIVQCLGILHDRRKKDVHADAREELDILHNDIYFLTQDDIVHVTDFLSKYTDRIKTELDDRRSTALSVLVEEPEFTAEAVKHLHVAMSTHRAVRKIDRELSAA